jgi:branched-chain amino acid transport system substrate-binding protein
MRLLTGIVAATCMGAAAYMGGAPAVAAETLKIGDVNSYTSQAAFTAPYRNGMKLAVDEINAKGGVLGQQIELITRDDAGKPEEAQRQASELVLNEHVAVLTGTFASNVGLAVSDFAKEQKIPFIAAEALSDALTWERGNHYTFRLRSSTYMQAAMLAEAAAKLPAKTWAIIAPNYEFGHSVSDSFKALLKKAKPDVEFVIEQYPPLGRIDAAAVVQVVAAAKPEALFNATFGPDLVRLVREGNNRDLFHDLSVVSIMTGQPEFIDPLKAEAPKGWIVTGYPYDAIDKPEHKAFLAAYEKAYNDYPRAGSLSGYTTVRVVAAAVEKAGGTTPEALIKALEGLQIESPLGPITMRAIDHQSTLGMYVGKTIVKNGKGTMEDIVYRDGANYLPDDDEVKRRRPQQ